MIDGHEELVGENMHHLCELMTKGLGRPSSVVDKYMDDFEKENYKYATDTLKQNFRRLINRLMIDLFKKQF